MFGRVNNWGKAIIFIFGAIFFSITFYYQVDSNTTQIDYNFAYLEKQIEILNDRIDKKHDRQEATLITLKNALYLLEKKFQAEKLQNAKYHSYNKGLKEGQKSKK